MTRPAKIWSESRKIVDTGVRLELVDPNSLMSMVDAVASRDDAPPLHRHRDTPARFFTGSRDAHAHELLHFADFDVVVLEKDDASLMAFEHADLAKIYCIERKAIESRRGARDLRFAAIRDRCSGTSAFRVVHDQTAVQLAARVPFGTRETLVRRWEREFLGEIEDDD